MTQPIAGQPATKGCNQRQNKRFWKGRKPQKAPQRFSKGRELQKATQPFPNSCKEQDKEAKTEPPREPHLNKQNQQPHTGRRSHHKQVIQLKSWETKSHKIQKSKENKRKTTKSPNNSSSCGRRDTG
jgi:hypothetical protein